MKANWLVQLFLRLESSRIQPNMIGRQKELNSNCWDKSFKTNPFHKNLESACRPIDGKVNQPINQQNRFYNNYQSIKPPTRTLTIHCSWKKLWSSSFYSTIMHWATNCSFIQKSFHPSNHRPIHQFTNPSSIHRPCHERGSSWSQGWCCWAFAQCAWCRTWSKSRSSPWKGQSPPWTGTWHCLVAMEIDKRKKLNQISITLWSTGSSGTKSLRQPGRCLRGRSPTSSPTKSSSSS